MEEVTINRIEWTAPEYSHQERTVDFFWTIGLISVVACGIAVFMHDYLFGVFILVSGFCLILFTVRAPHEIKLAIDSKGIFAGPDMFTWKSLKGFHIKDHAPYAKLMIATDKRFLPVYTIPLPHNLANEVKESLLTVIPDMEIEESQSTLLMEKLGF